MLIGKKKDAHRGHSRVFDGVIQVTTILKNRTAVSKEFYQSSCGRKGMQ